MLTNEIVYKHDKKKTKKGSLLSRLVRSFDLKF